MIFLYLGTHHIILVKMASLLSQQKEASDKQVATPIHTGTPMCCVTQKVAKIYNLLV